MVKWSICMVKWRLNMFKWSTSVVQKSSLQGSYAVAMHQPGPAIFRPLLHWWPRSTSWARPSLHGFDGRGKWINRDVVKPKASVWFKIYHDIYIYIYKYRYIYIYQYNVHKNHIFELYYSVFTKITSMFSKAENVFLHSRWSMSKKTTRVENKKAPVLWCHCSP